MISFFDLPLYAFYCVKNPLRLVDIGASGGLPQHWERAKNFLEVIAFEPDARAFNELIQNKNSKYTYLNSALHSKKTSLDFYCTRKQEVSSIFQPNRDFLDQFPDAQRFDILQKVTVEADTLDHQLAQSGFADIDFIKVDTQGSELFILQGAEQTLQSVFGIEVEVEFAELYKGQPLFSDVERYLRERGFFLFDLRPYYWKRTQGQRYGKSKGQLIFADALFLKKQETFIVSSHARTVGNEGKAKIMRALAICSLYGYCDYAIEIIAHAKKVFSLEESARLIHFFSKQISGNARIPFFRGRGKIASVFRRLAALIEPTDWTHTGGTILGNR